MSSRYSELVNALMAFQDRGPGRTKLPTWARACEIIRPRPRHPAKWPVVGTENRRAASREAVAAAIGTKVRQREVVL